MEKSEILYNVYKKVLLANKMTVSQFIEDYNMKIKEDPNEVIKNLSLLNKEDQLTPVQVVDKMIGKLEDISNPDFIFLDPNCKRGSFLVTLHEKYGIPKERLFGVDREPNNVKLLHHLGYSNVIVGNILEENSILELEKLKENMGFKDKKFDIVICNPPYSGSLHIDIFEKCYEELLSETGKICFIQPASFLINVRPGNDGKVTKYNKLRDKLQGHVESVYIDNFNKAFSIAQKYPLVIWSSSRKINDNGISFKLFDETEKTIASIFDANLIGNYETIQSIHNKVKSKITDTLEKHLCKSNKELPKGNACLSIGTYMLNTIGASCNKWSFDKLHLFETHTKNSIHNTFNCYHTMTLPLNNDFYSRPKGVKNGTPCDVIVFNNEDDAKRCYDISLNNPLFLFLSYSTMYDENGVMIKYQPWLDWSKDWTDDEIYKFFEINDKEHKLIEDTVKKFDATGYWFRRYFSGLENIDKI